MKVTEAINSSSKTLFSFEILPPLKGESIQSLFDSIDPLMDFKPSFIDVTYHREEYDYKRRENGLLEKRTVKKRPGTVGICSAILNKFQVDTVPHIICGGFTKEETENALIDLNFLGIENVLLLRGDSIKSELDFIPEEDGHRYASELITQVVNLNQGKYLDEDLQNSIPTNFCIGVAGYPEKHFEAPNLERDLKMLKMKVDMGAEYIVTQMFFDNKVFIDFVKKCRELGINIPIIPGIKPLTTKKQLSILSSRFHLDIPEELVSEVERASSNAIVREIGTEWAIQQCKELIKEEVPCLHFYTMGKSENVRNICSAIY